MKTPFFSIIIPTLNEEYFLPHLLRSLAEQTFRDFEVIVSDAHSQDKTVSLAKRYEKKLPSLVVVSDDRSSPSRQRNAGASVATGQWLLFIDADGVMLPYGLSRLQTFITKEKPSHFTTWFTPDSQLGNDALLTLLINGSLEAAVMMKRPVAYGQFAGIKHSVFKEMHGYDESVKWGEDNDISRRIYEAGYVFKILRETILLYSLRRFRKKGTIRMLQTYARAAFQVLLTHKTPNDIPGYIMGGNYYLERDLQSSRSLLNNFQRRLKSLTKELFGTS